MARVRSFKMMIAPTHPPGFFLCFIKPHQLAPFVLFMHTCLKLQDTGNGVFTGTGVGRPGGTWSGIKGQLLVPI